MAQSMASAEFVFEKLNELNYEELIVIEKVMDFKEQGIADKGTKSFLFKVIWMYLSSTKMETPDSKAIFEKLENFFKNKIYQQENEKSKIQSFVAKVNKNKF